MNGPDPATSGPDGPRISDDPLALYVHLPWCVAKCPYCDFNSHPVRGGFDEAGYVRALLDDLTAESARAGRRPVASVFFGGGTPSLFSAQSIGRILDAASRRFVVAPDAEITLEANPGTADSARFHGYRAAGVNRLSLGVQSFDDVLLRALGRIHDGAAARRAIVMAHQAGFARLNLDLMYGLPGQTPAGACRDLTEAAGYATTHLSWYQLTLEPHTAFAAQPPVLPNETRIDAMETEGRARLADAGFERYEISAYARDGAACRHNRHVWEFGDYLGIGAGAHGKLTSPGEGAAITRRVKHRHPTRYLEDPVGGEHAAVEGDERAFEFLLNALRLTGGFAPELFEQRTGLAWDPDQPAVRTARKRGLLDVTSSRCRPTSLGLAFLNDLQSLFLPRTGPGGDSWRITYTQGTGGPGKPRSARPG